MSDNTRDQILTLSVFIILLLLIYTTYQILNILVTILKQKKREGHMDLCLSDMGKFAYIAMIILYVIMWGILVWSIVVGVKRDTRMIWLNNGMAALTIYSFIFATQLANLVILGKKHMLVGRMLIDYRKMKKVDLNSRNQMSFVFSQRTYKFSTRFVDIKKLREAIARKA